MENLGPYLTRWRPSVRLGPHGPRSGGPRRVFSICSRYAPITLRRSDDERELEAAQRPKVKRRRGPTNAGPASMVATVLCVTSPTQRPVGLPERGSVRAVGSSLTEPQEDACRAQHSKRSITARLLDQDPTAPDSEPDARLTSGRIGAWLDRWEMACRCRRLSSSRRCPPR